jgi:alpha-L-arabinofuranosidase
MGRLARSRVRCLAGGLVLAVIALALGSSSRSIAGPLNTVTVDLQQIENPRAPLLLGMSFDARASFADLQDTTRGIGYYDRHTGAPLPIGAQWEDEWSQTALRYPQGPINVWEWKKTVGPVAQRANVGNLGQSAAFGLQEFLDMAERNGTSPADLTIMVNLYGPGGFASPNTALAVQDARDLVAYLNEPWDGQPFDGTNYEALRAQSHVEPYGVKYFNLGNEPWGAAEFDYPTTGDPNPMNDGALRYVALAEPFITAMRSVDSTVWIAVPGPSVSLNPAPLAKALAWNDTLMQHLGGQIQAISTNMYYEFEPGDLGPRGVQKIGDALNLVSARIATYNAQHGTSIRQVIGEHGNALDFDYSTHPPTQLDPVDFNMNYQAAVTTADFLMMASNMPELERLHHFIWGNLSAVWRPIRSELVGGQWTTRVLPPADLYRVLGGKVMDQTASAVTASVPGSDGETYAVRGGAFRSADGTHATVILVNRDPSVDQTIDVLNLNGYSIQSATIMTGDSASGFTSHFDPFPFSPGQTRFEVPHLAVLMLDYQLGTLGVGPTAAPAGPSFAGAFPNPAVGTTRLRYALPGEARARIEVFDAGGRRVRVLAEGRQSGGEHSVVWDARDASGLAVRAGVYWARLDVGGSALCRKVVLIGEAR